MIQNLNFSNIYCQLIIEGVTCVLKIKFQVYMTYSCRLKAYIVLTFWAEKSIFPE